MPSWPIHFVTLARPAFALSALLAVLPWIFWRGGWRRGPRHGLTIPWPRPLLQSLAVLLLAAALADPRYLGASNNAIAVFTDVSASQGEPPAAVNLGPWERKAERFSFAGGVARTALQQEATPATEPSATPGLDPLQTLIAPPLALITSHRGGNEPWRSAVIVTDGQFQDAADWPALAAQVRGIPLLIVPRTSPQEDARVADFSAVRRGGKTLLRATLLATAPMDRTLRIRRQGESRPLLEQSVRLKANEPTTVQLADEPPADRPVQYLAELAEKDSLPGNNSMSAVALPQQPLVLWVDGSGAWPAPQGLPHFTVDSIPPAQVPARPDNLLPYAAIAIVDPTGQALNAEQRQVVAQYVELGGGLVYVGPGPHQTPQDRDDPLCRVLPLQVNSFERKNLDVTLILDASGSMGEPAPAPAAASTTPRRFDLVREAAVVLARRQLVEGDCLRVMTFGSMVTPRFAGAPTPEHLAELEAVLANIHPVGGTRIAPAFEEALKAAPPKKPGDQGHLDHLVIVLSDLQTEDFDAHSWALRLAQHGLSLAVISTGEARENAPLKTLAQELGAPLVHRADLAGLSDVFARFLQDARGDALIRSRQKLAAGDVLQQSGISALPDAEAYFSAVLVPKSELLASTGNGSPVIARRTCSAGRSLSIALPVNGGVNAAFRDALPSQRLLQHALDWSAAPPGAAGFEATLQHRPDGMELAVTAGGAGLPVNGLSLRAQVSTASQSDRQVDLEPVAPGEFRCRLSDSPAEPMMISVHDLSNSRIVWRGVFPGQYPEELANIGIDEANLRRLAELTGGQVVPMEQLPQRLAELHASGMTPLYPALLMAALGLMLASWVIATPLPRRERSAARPGEGGR